MTLQEQLAKTGTEIARIVPTIEEEKKVDSHQRRLEQIAHNGKSYTVTNPRGVGHAWHISNQSLKNKGAPYALRNAVVSESAVYINGGITGGDSFQAPFMVEYGSLNHDGSMNGHVINYMDTALELLVTAELYADQSRLSESACLVEYAKEFADVFCSTVGKNLQLRRLYFKSEDATVHASIYEAIGQGALQIAEKCLQQRDNLLLIKEQFALAKQCLEQSQLPLEQVEYPFTENFVH